MRHIQWKIGLMAFLILGIACSANAQTQRQLIYEGNKAYEVAAYEDALVAYKKALDEVPDHPVALFNLGNAYYQLERYDDAIVYWNMAAQNDLPDSFLVHYNKGNALMKNQKLDEAIEAYKQSLRLNPSNEDAKYNLTYARKLKEQSQEQDQQDQDQNQDKDGEQDQDQDQEGDEEQQQQDDGDDGEDGEEQEQQQQDGDGDEEEQEEEGASPSEGEEGEDGDEEEERPIAQELSKEEIERLLDALRNNEAEVQKRLLLKQDEDKKDKRKESDKDW